MDALLKSKVFENWDFESLKKVYLKSIKKEFKKGELVFDESEESHNVYLINYGEFGAIF